MCEIYGISSKRSITINNDLRHFFDHSHKHCHGWGLAIMDGNYSLIKEGIAAYKSEILKQKMKNNINARLAIAHIRYATSGIQSRVNAHPFEKRDILGNRWTLVHNGTATNGFLVNKFSKYTEGQTDSENILIFFVSRINKAIILNNMNELSVKQKGDILQKAVSEISLNNRINLLFSDGENLYVHANLKGSLYYHRSEEYIVFATKPLADNYKWKELIINTIYIVNEGNVIYKGIPHKYEYFVNENTHKQLISV